MRTVLRSIMFALLCATAVLANAQPLWSARLKPVTQDGYYTVVLSPEVVGRSHPGMGDLRVLDSLKHEVPYVLEEDPAVYERTWMRTYKLLRNERVERSTIIEMEADSATVVDELQVHIRNAMVSKRARITGSDDRVNWYMIQDECLSVGEGDDATSVLRFVDLPLSDYRYYRLELNDRKSAPVQVLDLGHSGRARSEGRYTPIDDLAFGRVEDHNTTRIGLFGPFPFKADRITFAIHSGAPFARQGMFMRRTWHEVMDRRRKVERLQEETLGGFTLASYGRGTINGPGSITDTLWISIENQNDRPLEITGIRAFQLEHRLVAKLTAGMRYTITTGDAKASAPRYDLEQFRDSIPASIASLDMPTMIAAPTIQATEPLIAPGMKWVWFAIIGLGAVIAFSAIRMLRKTADTN